MVQIALEITSFILIIILFVSSFGQYKINKDLKHELNETLEINDSLKKEIKFQSNVNKTLREGLDALTKKYCHVKN
jgi:hypothetical protein